MMSTISWTYIEWANFIAESTDTDIILINASMGRPLDTTLVGLIKNRPCRKNVKLILTTPGGDPDVAYRIARILQNRYETFSIFVPGYCKSAGTLCVLGAHELIMSDQGELGPLDVQISKKDELGDFSSGLVAAESLAQLQDKAFSMFEHYFMTIKNRGGGHITFKTATEIAVKLSIGLMEPLYRQIDPIQVGEIARSMKIGMDYGSRLATQGNNTKPHTLATLTDSYSSHGFVIDRNEAESLFKVVREPTAEESSLADILGLAATAPMEQSICAFLNDPVQESQVINLGASNDSANQNRTDFDSSETNAGGSAEANGGNP